MYISDYTRAPNVDNIYCYCSHTDVTFLIYVELVDKENRTLGLPIIRTSSKVLITTPNKTDFR